MKIPPPHVFMQTEDGSPTIEMHHENGLIAEKMHNPRGAFEESIYIYAEALQECLTHSPSEVHVLSVGLGLGYNEVLAVCTWLNSSTARLELVSFEKDELLTANFVDYVFERPLEENFLKSYEWIFAASAERFGLKPEIIRSTLQKLYTQKNWRLRSSFHPCKIESNEHFNVILYDAFSAKMNAELWEEQNLGYMLKHHVRSPCYFATYAATGALNRALRGNGFELLRRPGFGGKRESTWGRRL